jgi:hypothetical protein
MIFRSDLSGKNLIAKLLFAELTDFRPVTRNVENHLVMMLRKTDAPTREEK